MYRRFIFLLTRTVGRYSIRKKFIIFGIFFITIVPLNFYIIYDKFDFNLERNQAQISGVSIEESLLTLMRNIVRLQVLSWSPAVGELSQDGKRSFIIERIENTFSSLRSELEGYQVAPIIFLGRGYSTVKELPIKIDNLEENWKKLQLLADKEPQSAQTFREFTKIIESIRQHMISVGYSSSLLLVNERLLFYLSELAIRAIPESLEIINEMNLLVDKLYFQTEGKEQVERDIQQELNRMRQSLESAEALVSKIQKADNEKHVIEGAENIVETIQTFNRYRSSVIRYMERIQNDFDMSSFRELGFEVIEYTKRLEMLILDDLSSVSKRKLKWNTIYFYWNLFQISFLSFFVFFFIGIRFVTSSMQVIIDELKRHVTGDFRGTKIIGYSDALGQVSNDFRSLFIMVNETMAHLAELNEMLCNASLTINHSLNKQTEDIDTQSKEVKQMIQVSQGIEKSIGKFIREMSDLKKTAERAGGDGNAFKGLDMIQDQMLSLNQHSNEISGSLEAIQERFLVMKSLVKFMERIGDQTQLLSINAAIEAKSFEKHEGDFIDTVEKIQRFSFNTLNATNDIQENIESMSLTTAKTHKEMIVYIRNIERGSQEVKFLQHQFDLVMAHSQNQWDIFMHVNQVMEKQVQETENIIVVLERLKEPFQHKKSLIKEIQNVLRELECAALEMDAVLSKFKFS